MAVMVLVIRNVHTWWFEYLDRHLQAFGGVSSIFSMHLYHVSPFTLT